MTLSIDLVIKDFLRKGLVVSPWLTMEFSHARLELDDFAYIDQFAIEFAQKYWNESEKAKIFGDAPFSARVPRTAVYETVSSTAMTFAHERHGEIQVSHEFILEAIEVLQEFVNEYTFSIFLRVYGHVMAYENAQAINYYGKIPEREFVLGSWHRPWVDYSLSDELAWGIYAGNYQTINIDGVNYVTLTQEGEKSFYENEQLLDDTGYLSSRIKQLQIFNFTFYQNYRDVVESFWPNFMDIRKQLLEWSGIKPGMKVLELGCADGISTLDASLANTVGEQGSVVAIDPSAGMIYRAKKRQEQMQVDWVDFIQAKAEELPFANDTFDAVIAFSSLHFMDLSVALKEIIRVLKPNGIFASMHPVKSDMSQNTLIAEWFQPVFKLARKRKESNPKDYTSYAKDIISAFERNHFTRVTQDQVALISYFKDPKVVAHHTFHGVGWAQEELSMIPWKAREDLIHEVIVLGENLCEKYSEKQRVIKSPMQLIKGYKSAQK